jgi:hypothetical protein
MGRAKELITGYKFELLISLERVEDGSAYDLMPLVADYAGSLVVGLQCSSGYLWLTVVDHGQKVLGASAMDYSQLEAELEDLLSHRSRCGTLNSGWVPAAPSEVSREETEPPAITIGPPEELLRRSIATGVPLLAIRPLPLVKLDAAFPAAERLLPNQK